MIDLDQFRHRIVDPTLEGIGLYSEWASNLLIGTALQESRLTYLAQLGGGPALGVYQMEPATHADIWDNWLKYRPLMNRKARLFSAKSNIPGATRPSPNQMVWNLRYATAMCRLHYYRASFEIPHESNLWSLGAIWKEHYNTPAGAGTVEEFAENYQR